MLPQSCFFGLFVDLTGVEPDHFWASAEKMEIFANFLTNWKKRANTNLKNSLAYKLTQKPDLKPPPQFLAVSILIQIFSKKIKPTAPQKRHRESRWDPCPEWRRRILPSPGRSPTRAGSRVPNKCGHRLLGGSRPTAPGPSGAHTLLFGLLRSVDDHPGSIPDNHAEKLAKNLLEKE